MGNKLFKVVLIVASLVLLSAGLAFAADNDNYLFEVKFLLDSNMVLDANNVPLMHARLLKKESRYRGGR